MASASTDQNNVDQSNKHGVSTATPQQDLACAVCSWTAARQNHCSYTSHVKIFYEAHTRGVWSIGNQVILKERDADGYANEIEVAAWLRQHTTIPVPNVIKHWTDGTRGFILMDKIPGQPLDKAWATLMDDDKDRIAEQTAAYLSQLRTLTSTRMERLKGEPVQSAWLFGDGAEPHGPFDSDEAFWLDYKKHIDDLPAAAQEKVRGRMPPCQPFTFTHADLTLVNIMVHEGQVSGLLDWEHAGYYPVWWEWAFARIGLSADDTEWKALLRKYMTPHEDAANLYIDMHMYKHRKVYPERAQKFLDSLT